MSTTVTVPDIAAVPDIGTVPDVSTVAGLADAGARAFMADAHRALSGVTSIDPAGLSANGLLAFEAGLAGLGRLIEGVQVADAAEITARSARACGLEGLAARHGCATGAQLIELVTGVSSRTARQRVRVAGQAAPRLSDTGTTLKPFFPAVAEALRSGSVGIDVADAITTTLKAVPPHVSVQSLAWAETLLVNHAVGGENESPLSADLIRGQAILFRDILDPDGVEPREDRLIEKRCLRFSTGPDGMLHISGALPPSQAAIVTPVFDAFLSPRTAPAFLAQQEAAEQDAPGQDVVKDPRSRDQQRADIFTALCEGAVKTGQTPKLHGMAAPVLVTITATALTATALTATTATDGAGFGTTARGTLPLSTVNQLACDGGTQNVLLGQDGEVLNLSSKDRFFSTAQRKALIARDGHTCAVPNCTIPAYWAEAHHIVAWQHHGSTTVDNAVLTCWYHHRMLHRGEWTVSLVSGTPRFRPPPWYTARSYLEPHRRR